MTLPSDEKKNEAGIPVFMVGRSAENGREILPALAPDFDIIHFCTSTAAARQELSAVLDGKQVSDPQTTLGSNTKRGASPRKPAAIFVGAGFEREDYEAFRRDIGDGHGLSWVREERTDIEGLDNPDNWMVRESIGRVPRPEVLIKSVSKVLSRDLLAR